MLIYKKLIYKNGTIVRHLPETSRPFVLQEYKMALGMPYSQICLYLIEYEASDDEDDLYPKVSINISGKSLVTNYHRSMKKIEVLLICLVIS